LNAENKLAEYLKISEIGIEEDLQLGVLDNLLNVSEYVLSFFSWSFRATSPSPIPPTQETIAEFDVIHTNWYWRHLRRKLRFRENCIERIHPDYNDTRASHDYTSILSIRVKDPSNAVFEYQLGSPDYIYTKPSDLKKMVHIIQTKNPNVQLFFDFSDNTE